MTLSKAHDSNSFEMSFNEKGEKKVPNVVQKQKCKRKTIEDFLLKYKLL